MKKIIIFTSTSLRHKFLRMYLSNVSGIKVLRTYSEYGNSSIKKKLDKKLKVKNRKIIEEHLKKRINSEKDFFSFYTNNFKDNSNNLICKSGFISTNKCFDQIKEMKPDLILVFGASILKGKIIKKFKGKIINIHLGLSPYYRGAGTNYFPIINEEPEFIGASFMFLDEGIDTGEIFHQIQAKIYTGDTFHQLCNRLILDCFEISKKLILNFNKIKRKRQIKSIQKHHFYKKNDFTSASLKKLNLKLMGKKFIKYLKKPKKIKLIKQAWIN